MARQGALVPTLGLFSVTMLIAGSVIGSGIYRLPSSMMALVQDPAILVMVWIAAGAVAVCGALTLSELAGMFPRAGGQYVFLREALGRRWAFLYGWSMFWVIQTGIMAALAVVFAEFLGRLLGYDAHWVPVVAVGCILFLSIVNYFGVRFGGLVQNVITVVKVGSLVALVAFGLALGEPGHQMFDQAKPETAPGGGALVTAFFLALLLGFFAYDGWYQAALVSPEVKDAQRNVPRGTVMGVGLICLLYIAATLLYVYLVPLAEMMDIAASQGLRLISVEAAEGFGGDVAGRLVAAAVVVSTFGTVNAFVLSSPRVFYAVARDRLQWHPFAQIHPRWNTPHKGLLFGGLWASYLVVLAFFSREAYLTIIEAVTFAQWLFYIPTAYAHLRLRRVDPGRERPFRTPLSPVVPIVWLTFAVAVVVTLLATNVYDIATKDLTSEGIASLSGIWGSVLILTGVPFLLLWTRKERRGDVTPLTAAAEA